MKVENTIHLRGDFQVEEYKQINAQKQHEEKKEMEMLTCKSHNHLKHHQTFELSSTTSNGVNFI